MTVARHDSYRFLDPRIKEVEVASCIRGETQDLPEGSLGAGAVLQGRCASSSGEQSAGAVGAEAMDLSVRGGSHQHPGWICGGTVHGRIARERSWGLGNDAGGRVNLADV